MGDITRDMLELERTTRRPTFTSTQSLYFDTVEDVMEYLDTEEVGEGEIMGNSIVYTYNLPTGEISNIYTFPDETVVTAFTALTEENNGDSIHRQALFGLPSLNTWYY